MNDSVNYNQFLDYSSDNRIWKPITGSECDIFLDLIHYVETALETGTNKEKGDSLENLMTFIYNRFTFVDVVNNVRTIDNQIDHIVKFIDGMVPTFIHQHVGLIIIGESKNHKEAISVREVTDLNELLRSKKAKLGIFSSYKSFSKGKSLWTLAEGKRRKLAIASDKIIIGFNLFELKSLINNNFYTMLKQKFDNIVDEINDDYTDEEISLLYQDRLHNSLYQLYLLDIIPEDDYLNYKKAIQSKYGNITK